MRKTVPILFVSMILLVSSMEIMMPGPRRVYASPGKHRNKANAMAQQAQVRAYLANEDVIAHIETMADLQVKYGEKVALMVDQGQMDRDQGARLVAGLYETLEELEQKAHNLRKIKDAEERRRSRRGFFAALGRFFRGIGRFIGKTIGGVVYTTGKLARFAIEDVAPVLIVEKVKAIVEGKINLLLEKLRGKIGHQAFDILVEVVKAIRRGKKGGDVEGSSGVVFYDDHCNVTIQYDLAQAYNPWPPPGGAEYGPIEYLLEIDIRAYLYEEDELQYANELASEAENRKGFSQFGIREVTDAMASGTVPSYKSGGLNFLPEDPHSGFVEVDIEYPLKLRLPHENRTSYYFVFISQIRYAAFGGYWYDVNYLGPIEIEVGNGF
ncbi:MAG: hypothetical protein HXS50_00975 [Theionarchaea archaeon]|nr:hypothetical protein [Theionarchaea archaeon]